jgi:hypothetical protein
MWISAVFKRRLNNWYRDTSKNTYQPTREEDRCCFHGNGFGCLISRCAVGLAVNRELSAATEEHYHTFNPIGLQSLFVAGLPTAHSPSAGFKQRVGYGY